MNQYQRKEIFRPRLCADLQAVLFNNLCIQKITPDMAINTPIQEQLWEASGISFKYADGFGAVLRCVSPPTLVARRC